MDDRALGVLVPVGDDWALTTANISQPLPWEQWCSIDQPGPFGSFPDEASTANSVYTPIDPDSFAYRSDTSSTDLWADNNPITKDTNQWSSLVPITEISPSFLPCEPKSPAAQDDWHHPWTPEKPSRKRNRNINSLRNSDTRGSSSKKNTNPLAKEETQQATIRRNRNARDSYAYEIQPRKVNVGVARERNRLAANKFRAKQREDWLKLESSEQDLERIHHNLSTCVANLTLEVYKLKMELLQHSGCNCALIQNYLVHESQRYVQALEGSSPGGASKDKGAIKTGWKTDDSDKATLDRSPPTVA